MTKIPHITEVSSTDSSQLKIVLSYDPNIMSFDEYYNIVAKIHHWIVANNIPIVKHSKNIFDMSANDFIRLKLSWL